MTEPLWLQQYRWHAVADVQSVRRVAAARILAAADRALGARGRFVLVLAGGDTPRGVYELLRDAKTDWSAWQVYFGDERCAPPDDPARNSRMAGSAWLDHVPIPEGQVHEIPAERGPGAAAERYAKLLEPVGEFDLVLLGLGEDGHTASLFPGHELGQNPDAPSTLPVFDAPKPPPDRVTMSAHRLSRTAEAMFMVSGDDKRDAVTRWRGGESIPARTIMPKAGVDVVLEAAILRPLQP
jgi:6-phosphogluconolactonase